MNHRNATTMLLILVCFASQTRAQPPRIATDKDPNAWTRINPMNWSMPKFKVPKVSMPKMSFPSWGKKKSTSTARKTSFWSKLAGGTRRTWNKTTDLLNPFDNRGKKKGPSFFDELFTIKEEPRPVQTVGDFLSQPHPY